MPTKETAGLPAPISLTLDEARQVAAGSLAVSAFPWWWFGQPADIARAQVTQPLEQSVGAAPLEQSAGLGR
jgi:hypothetical protein